MTLLAGFQGKNCALVASDLMVGHYAPDQLHLPLDQRVATYFISEKFRQLPNGDYLAFNGALNFQEERYLYRQTLSQMRSVPLESDQNIRQNHHPELIYVSIGDNQLYYRQLRERIKSFYRGQPIFFMHDQIRGKELLEMTTSLMERRNGKYDVMFLEELSRLWENFILSIEQHDNSFGGYSSHIFSQRRIRALSIKIGKLEGIPELRVSDEGLVAP